MEGGYTGWVNSVVFSPDSATLASGSQDGIIRLWDAGTGALIRTLIGHTGWISRVAFSPDGNTIASGGWGDNTVGLWDVGTGTLIRMFTGHTGSVREVAFSPDGNILASGGGGGIRLWDVGTGTLIRTLTGHTRWVKSVAFSPDGNILASGSVDETIRLWDVGTGTPIRTLTHTNWGWSLAFSPDGNTLASTSGLSDGILLWDVGTGTLIRTLTGHADGVNSLAFSPDGNTLTSGSDDATVRLWEAVTGQHKQTLTGHTGSVREVAFSPDGNTLASSSDDGTVLLWEITPPATAEFLLSVPAGISLIHVPLKVTEVDSVAQPITSIADLYHALGGAASVNLLITYDPQTGKWFSYASTQDKGTSGDKALTDDTGIVAVMKNAVTLRLSGNPLGTNGNSTITLNRGINLVGVPLRAPNINRVSDLFTIEGIAGNVGSIIVSDNGTFKVVGQAGDAGDIEITGGQAFILTARQAGTVAISGAGWTNDSGTAAAPPMAIMGIEVGETTPVLALRGAIVSPVDGWGRMPHLRAGSGFRVTVKNLSTGRTVTDVIGEEHLSLPGEGESKGGDYRLTVVDIETGRAATIGDILEISVKSPDPSIKVQPLRYTVTDEDVKRSLIQLEALDAYEIPAETELLPNYPNPFNPETWIPYRLAEDALVTLTIYDGSGRVVRTLDVGHQVAAVYESRSKAVYWDGRNEVGERIASGVYFYHLSAGDYSATRKMVILK